MAPKMIKKALGFPLKVEGVLRPCKMSKKHWSQTILEHPEKLIKIPYKTCRIRIISESKSQNGTQNDQKSIRFSLKVEGVLRPCKMSKKALVPDHFGASRKVDQNT